MGVLLLLHSCRLSSRCDACEGGTRAATLFELALPGSAYLYQGKELGLHEVGDIADDARQDPTFFRNPGASRGRDGCRVPLLWTENGASFGFGEGPAHLPQPDWFGDVSVEAQDGDPASTLTLYRKALHLRRQLQTAENLTWVDELSNGEVIAFARSNGWVTMTNFGDEPVALPAGEVLITSSPLDKAGLRPGSTTVWLKV
jgi:alpha-glucosidase